MGTNYGRVSYVCPIAICIPTSQGPRNGLYLSRSRNLVAFLPPKLPQRFLHLSFLRMALLHNAPLVVATRHFPWANPWFSTSLRLSISMVSAGSLDDSPSTRIGLSYASLHHACSFCSMDGHRVDSLSVHPGVSMVPTVRKPVGKTRHPAGGRMDWGLGHLLLPCLLQPVRGFLCPPPTGSATEGGKGLDEQPLPRFLMHATPQQCLW